MALNFDTAIRLTAQVRGLNEFKNLTDQLGNVESAAKDSAGGVQQLSAEAERLTQQSNRSTNATKAQTTALQDLQTRAQSAAAGLRRTGEGANSLRGQLDTLRATSGVALDGLGKSAARGAEGVKSLQLALQPTDAQISALRQEVLALGQSTKQTERSIADQVAALKTLRSQAEINGTVYNELTSDIERLGGVAKGLGAEMMFGVEGVRKMGSASQSAAQSIELQIKSLTRLQSTLVKGSEGYRAIGREIDVLKQKAAGLDLNGKMAGATAAASPAGGAMSGITGALSNLVSLRRQLAQSDPGRVVLAGEGLAAAGLAGAAGSGAAAGLGGLASNASAVANSLDAIAAKAQALPAYLKPIGNLLSGPAAAAGQSIAEWGSQLSAAQAKLAALAGPFQAINTAIGAIGPEAAAAAGAASLAIASVYQVLSRQADKAQADAEQAFKGISDDAQRALESLVRLYDRMPSARLAAQQQLRDRNLARLGEVAPDSVEARRAANAVVQAEKQIAEIKGEQNRLIDEARKRENASAEALQRQVQAGRDKVATARQELTLAERIAQVQRRAAERRREMAAADESERIRRAAAEQAAQQVQVRALPAAGQTAFQGTVRADGTGGGARTSLDGIEVAGTRQNVGGAMPGVSPEARAAMNQQTAATDKARESLSKLFIEIDKAEAASNGSVNSLQRQRAAWEALRNAVNPAAPAYERARAKVQQLDEQLKRLSVTQERSARQGIGREAVGGALGALATGSGPMGAMGALAGGLAFSGSAAGLAAAGGITLAAGAGALATRAGLDAEQAQTRLRALTEAYGEYNEAQRTVIQISGQLRIGQTEAADAFSKLYGALRPTGVSIKEMQDVYVGFTAAARASGASVEESAAAFLQLKQSLGSGVLQGDELRSILESAPALAQGVVRSLNNLGTYGRVTRSDLKQLASEGKISTDVVISALQGLGQTELPRLQAQFNTGQQAIKDFQTAVTSLGERLAEIFGPAGQAALRAFTKLIERTTELLRGEFGQNSQERMQARMQAGREAMARFSLRERITKNGEYRAFFEQRERELLAEVEQRQRQRRASSEADNPNAEQRQAREDAENERRAQRERAERMAMESQLKIRLDMEEKLADAAEQRIEQVEEFRRQTIKQAQDLERTIGDERLRIEQEIAQTRRNIEFQQMESALMRQRDRLQELGQDTGAIDTTLRIRQIVRDYTDQKIRNEQDAAERVVQIQRRLEDFKIQVAEGIGKIEEGYARSVADILKDAGRKLAAEMVRGAREAAQTLNDATPGPDAPPASPAVSRAARGTLGSVAPNLTPRNRALLDTIAYAEGANYNTLFGGGTFSDYSRHPDRVIRSGGYASAAAGRYQFMPGTWNNVARQLRLPDFSPAAQDMAALQLVRARGVDPNRPLDADVLNRLAPEWASLPTLSGASYYGQPVKRREDLVAFYNERLRLYGAADQVQRQQQPARTAADTVRVGDRVGYDNPTPQRASTEGFDPAPITGRLRQQSNSLGAQVTQGAELRQNELFGGAIRQVEDQIARINQPFYDMKRQVVERLEYERQYSDLLQSGVTPELADQLAQQRVMNDQRRAGLEAARDELRAQSQNTDFTVQQRAVFAELADGEQRRIDSLEQQQALLERQTMELEKQKRLREMRQDFRVGEGFQTGVEEYVKSIGTLKDAVTGLTVNGFQGLDNALTELVVTGKANWQAFAADMLRQTARIIIQQLVLRSLLQAIGLIPGAAPAGGGITGSISSVNFNPAAFSMPALANANGNAFGPAGLVPFAYGGIVDRPTFFKFANGGQLSNGVMGEAGPEAIIPLKRGKDGRLGVAMQGGGSQQPINVSVSVDATGSQVQGNATEGQQLGRAVAAAVQAELVRQKRPGGLLAA